MTLVVRPISVTQHLGYLEYRPGISFLQLPSWGRIKSDWASESIGWFDGDALVGAGLVLKRKLPGLGLHLAYLPEGPDLDWTGEEFQFSLDAWLTPMVDYLRRGGAFAVKIGPRLVVRRWRAATVKQAISDSAGMSIGDIRADLIDHRAVTFINHMRDLGWTQRPDSGAGFVDSQPRYMYQLPLLGQTEETLFAGFNQMWRRNIRKAQKVGVKVDLGGRADIEVFHSAYSQTAARDGFVPRPLTYFQQMWDVFAAEDGDRIRLYLAYHQDRVLAANLMVCVGDHASYTYGGSLDTGREVRPSNALQWRMLCDSLNEGRRVYDLRGISGTFDPGDPLLGLMLFKLGMGGEACEYVGEWNFAIKPTITRIFNMYLRRDEFSQRAKAAMRISRSP